MKGFDLILVRDWLGFYNAPLDCHRIGVLSGPPGNSEFFFPCRLGGTEGVLVSVHLARSLMRSGCMSFLVSVSKVQDEPNSLADIDVVREYPDVFPDDLSGLPPDRAIEFSIDLVPGIAPISKAPYRMHPLSWSSLKSRWSNFLTRASFVRVLRLGEHLSYLSIRRMGRCLCALTIN